MTAQEQAMQAQQLNMLARQAVLAASVPMEQQCFGSTYTSSTGVSGAQPQVIIQPRYVGLITGFMVKVVQTITNGSGVTLNLTDFGPANAFSQILFNDLSNTTRIQTAGWHVNLVNSIVGRRPFGTAVVRSTGYDTPMDFGSNWSGQISASATIATMQTGTITMWYWVPLAYSDQDLRGAMYANVVNATAQLILTHNPTPIVASGTDSTLAMYVGATSGTVAAAFVTSSTITVYQNYLDQLPVGQGGVVLPMQDLGTIYELKNTVQSSVVVNQDFPIQYANFRDFLSTWAIYVNTGSTGARGTGSDINYWAMQSANFTNIWKREPALVALRTRQMMQTDPEPGCYYFGSRNKPISTVQYGNQQLVLNASTAGAGAYLLMGYEDFALVNTLNMMGSLPAS